MTGIAGFVGRTACARAVAAGHAVRGAVRQPRTGVDYEPCVIGDIGAATDWKRGLQGIDAVLHMAARVHVMREQASDPLAAFRAVNTAGTLALAAQAAAAGVKRFVFISSIAVNGNQTDGRPYRESDAVAPHDAYGISKYEAEQGLFEIAAATGMEIVVLRPPLVYGPDAPGNFATLVKWIKRGVPLPFGAVVGNRRSLIGVDNLADLAVTCLDHPAAANELFLAADGMDLSTADLLRRVGDAIGRPARLVPVPPALLAAGARITGRSALADRLLGSLQIDISKVRERLGWTPPVEVDEGLRRLAGRDGASV